MPQVNRIKNIQQALGEKLPFSLQYVGVAGGGGAASGSNSSPEIGAGGGAGGGVITGSIIPERDTVYTIVVGDGGTPAASGSNGENTVLFSQTALGGGGGVQTGFTGSNGGSGGGGSEGGTALQPTASSAGFGNDGGGEVPLELEFLAVAGGGGGVQTSTSPGDASNFGSGGGGGGVLTGSFSAQKQTTYEIIVGDGGAPTTGVNPTAETGENSSVFECTAFGGGAAGGDGNKNGGSGGGSDSAGGVALQPTSSCGGFGNNGADNDSLGSGGGGAANSGSGQLGGAPISLDFTGTFAFYGGGGNGYERNTAPLPTTASIGKGGDGGFSSDAGGTSRRDATSGSVGIVIVKYLGEPKAIGGTITQSDGYTYHTYSSVGTGSFTVLGTGGGGGGAGEAGFDGDSHSGGNGGDGILLNLYSSPIKYAPGGAGWGVSGSGTPGEGTFGAGGSADDVSPESGSAGVGIVRYRGIPKATGGIITSDDRYTYHLFQTGSSDFTWLV